MRTAGWFFAVVALGAVGMGVYASAVGHVLQGVLLFITAGLLAYLSGWLWDQGGK